MNVKYSLSFFTVLFFSLASLLALQVQGDEVSYETRTTLLDAVQLGVDGRINTDDLIIEINHYTKTESDIDFDVLFKKEGKESLSLHVNGMNQREVATQIEKSLHYLILPWMETNPPFIAYDWNDLYSFASTPQLSLGSYVLVKGPEGKTRGIGRVVAQKNDYSLLSYLHGDGFAPGSHLSVGPQVQIDLDGAYVSNDASLNGSLTARFSRLKFAFLPWGLLQPEIRISSPTNSFAIGLNFDLPLSVFTRSKLFFLDDGGFYGNFGVGFYDSDFFGTYAVGYRLMLSNTLSVRAGYRWDSKDYYSYTVGFGYLL